jgi:hypothetical protein
MEGKCLESAGASNRVSPPVGAALSLFSKASSLFARKQFPVMSHREFIRNYLVLRLIPISVSSPKAQKRRNSLFFSLLAGNLDLADRFGGTTSTTRWSARPGVISSVAESGELVQNFYTALVCRRRPPGSTPSRASSPPSRAAGSDAEPSIP